jgi:glyoxalase family protein
MCAVTHGANALHHMTAIPGAEMAPPRAGSGLAMEGDLEIPHGGACFWAERLQRDGTAIGSSAMRFGQPVLACSDPRGLNVAPVEAQAGRPFTLWDGSPVGAGHQIAPSSISHTRTERWWR